MSEAIRQEKKVLELEWREDEIKQSIKDHQQKLKDIISQLAVKTSELNALMFGIESIKNPDKYKELNLDYPDLVLNLVSEVFKIGVNDMRGKRRMRPIVMARNCAAALIYTHMQKSKNKMSLSNLGKFLGGKDHTTILHAIKCHDIDMQMNATYRTKVNTVNELILQNA